MEQRLEFDENGKLVARINGAITDGKNTTFKKIEGEFLVSADIVNYILAQEYDLALSIVAEMKKRLNDNSTSVGITSRLINAEDDMLKLSELAKQYKEEYESVAREKRKLKLDILRFERAISDFNDSRRFYERKFDFKFKNEE